MNDTIVTLEHSVSHSESESFEIKRREGVKFPNEVVDQNFKHIKFKHVTGPKTKFTNCDFSFCEFDDAYFRKAVFENCKFTSVKCSNSNFRESKFMRCDFRYAQFSQTLIDEKELIANAPSQPNIRREFMMAARINAASIGDLRAIRQIIREELLAERQFHLEAWKGKDTWYKEKYPKFSQKFFHGLKSMALTFDWHLWGHGEYPFKFIISLVIMNLVFGLLVWIFGIGIDATQPLALITHQVWRAVVVASFIFLDIPIPISEEVPEFLCFLIVVARYVFLGLFTSMIFRLLSHR